MESRDEFWRQYRWALFPLAVGLLWYSGCFWSGYAIGTVGLFLLWRHLRPGGTEPSSPLGLQSKQPFSVEELGKINLPPEALYNAAVILTTHSDAMSWVRLYTLLTANSIILLAWAALFAGSSKDAATAQQLGFFLALPGFLLSLAWAPFGSRNRRLHRRWGDFYTAMERAARPGNHVGPGASAEALNYLIIEEHCKSGQLVVAVPLMFADIFLFLMGKSWTF